MTLEKAEMMRILRHEGAVLTSLARAFGCCLRTTERICDKATWNAVQCSGCWRFISPTRAANGGRCETCQAQVCSHCGGAKPTGRKSQNCAPCDRAKWKKILNESHRCRDCGEEFPITRRDFFCRDCRAEDTRIMREYRNNRGKVCGNEDCSNLLPERKTWSRALCYDCAKKNDRQRRALSRRQCGVCGVGLPDTRAGSICASCETVKRRKRRIEAILGRTITWEQAAEFKGRNAEDAAEELQRAARARAAGRRLLEAMGLTGEGSNVSA